MDKKVLYSYFLITVMLTTGCKKWVEVSPRLEIREEEFFTSETAFREAMNGVYYTMGSNAMYGGEMTWGMVDVLGDMYSMEIQSGSRPSPEYIPVSLKDFKAATVETRIAGIWGGSYQCIANINNLIKNLDLADSSIFTNGHAREQLYGEALGLRAFLHFDLVRLFGQIPTAAGNISAIPYVDSYSTSVKPLIPVQEVMKRVEADLLRAEQLLAQDPIILARVSSQAGLTTRKIKFNYYAVKALQARMHMWNGDHEQALLAAQTIIDAAPGRFPWTPINRVSVEFPSRDRLLSSELIFSLVIDKIVQHTTGIVNNVFEPVYGATVYNTNSLSISETKRQQVFETTTAGLTDLRNLYLIDVEEAPGNGSIKAIVYSKLKQAIYGTDTMGYRMPVFRISEMYYIAAECLAKSQPTKAIELLNTVRSRRGILSELPSSLTASEILAEIGKEYRKEFTCEGQVFFFKKRLGEVEDVLPLPMGETEPRGY